MKKELLPNLKIIIIVLALSSFVSALQSGPSFLNVTTDKARYSPHELVHFSAQLAGDAPAALVYVSYWHLDEEIDAQSFTIATNPVSWTWQPPPLDHQGYLAEIVLQTDEPDTTWIAVDVSSEWNKFPRYGFLSKYPDLSTLQIDNTLNELVRHHINGLQFYDWHYKHHLPLKGTPEQPAEFWPDIANRTNYRATVAGYIKTAHERNMVALSYNLLYGAYRDAATDGVSNEWRLFKDQAGAQPDRHDLPASWASDIYLIDPANPQWLDYILDKTALAFSVFDFDGWHIDQLGDRGVLYDYAGQEVSLPEAFSPFIASTKKSLSGSLVMNAVNQFGQAQIAASPVDFTYTEVWPPHDSYSALVSIIRQNRATGGLATVLAAYVNRARSAQPGTFNTPGVLLADAVIFAAGGAHLELGEHLLGNEYFPNDNLRMSDDLRRRLIVYYDFLVAYQNLLRDGGDFSQDYLQSEGEVTIRNIARRGSVWGFARTVGQRRVFHLINLVKATSLEWRDDAG
ncbi:glycoside hydrolase family 66 protein, partial [candidate division KSB1 bacterium]|nr:glycoside hydrolase family 66 protein [candidate division KSB1 bacterium]